MAAFLGFLNRTYTALNPPDVPRSTDSPLIKFGILGAAKIASTALISPAKTHPDVVVYGIAARDLERAQVFAKKHGIEKAYGGPDAYQQLLDDPQIDVVYNPLPNGLHYEWTMKALLAGKHVLLEKPAANTSEETKHMFSLAKEKGLVLLEAFHYRFHPVINRVKQIIDSGEIGKVKSIEHLFTVPTGLLKSDDIRFNFSLGGGSLMDEGCYILNCTRFLTGSEPISVLSASVQGADKDPRVDQTTTASLSFPEDVTATFTCSLGLPPRFGFIPHSLPKNEFKVIGEKGELFCTFWIIPTFYHYIEVTTKDGDTMKKRIEKVYRPQDVESGMMRNWMGGEWWTTYRYQLEAFVDRLKGRSSDIWISAEDSIGNMRAIEMIYEKAGLPSRPTSTFQSPSKAQ
ncbi:hypothetical protein QCA50_014119 [Cerrena zonata]|uniref:D-xylose 1-dehydrogenase (NADP(+), D-xylono-1,5-lactone-forming) n=1 Tax=Cerrena zonata TaxID=2478898 RepID=A0AAW0FPG2_9APHY